MKEHLDPSTAALHGFVLLSQFTVTMQDPLLLLSKSRGSLIGLRHQLKRMPPVRLNNTFDLLDYDSIFIICICSTFCNLNVLILWQIGIQD